MRLALLDYWQDIVIQYYGYGIQDRNPARRTSIWQWLEEDYGVSRPAGRPHINAVMVFKNNSDCVAFKLKFVKSDLEG